MTITIGSTLSFRTLRQHMIATGSGNKPIKTTKLKGSMTNSDVVALLTAQSLISNVGLITGTIDGYPINGYPADVDAIQNLVSAVCVLAFTRTNPVNTAKKITRNFTIPAYKAAIRDAETGAVIATDTNVAALITLLEANLAFEGSDGVWYAGSFTYDANKSGFGTVDMLEIE